MLLLILISFSTELYGQIDASKYRLYELKDKIDLLIEEIDDFHSELKYQIWEANDIYNYPQDYQIKKRFKESFEELLIAQESFLSQLKSFRSVLEPDISFLKSRMPYVSKRDI